MAGNVNPCVNELLAGSVQQGGKKEEPMLAEGGFFLDLSFRLF